MTDTVKCTVLKTVRISGKGYKAGDIVDVAKVHMNHYGKSITPFVEKKVNNKSEEK